MIVRQKEPLNLEMPFDEWSSFLTPTDLFYIRCHFQQPELDMSSYQLRIDGAVRDPLTLSYADLRAMPAETRVAALECAGNSRVFLTPEAEGAQWALGAVGNAEWTGVPLRALLEAAGIEEDACEIILEGADEGKPKEKPVPPGEISYARSLSRQKALQSEVLIAYQMNGRDLPREHGFPVRAVVPGHYGMASVKWLTRIEAVTEPFRGYWQTSDYAYWDFVEGRPVRRALGEIAIKSQISRPGLRESVVSGQTYTVCGAAWTGEGEVSEIWVSCDSGKTWSEGQFIDPVMRFAWRRWRFEWLTPRETGTYVLLSRAVDSCGVAQPEKHDQRFGSYVINHQLSMEVLVR